jgi:hypothetical protein
MLATPGFTSLYVTPELKHCTEFSRSKLQARLRYSPIVDQIFFRGTEVDNVFEKQLNNGSRIVLRSVYRDPISVRGISSDLVAIDEVQDMCGDHLPVIHETLSHSEHRIKLYAGTPKTRDDTLDQLWQRSTQTEWFFRCSEGHWAQGTFDVIQRDAMRCPTCGREMNRHAGEWVQAKRDAPLVGYRISQLLVPWVPWADIIDKLDTYGHEQFANEVLAIPMDSATHALSRGDILACCDPKQPMATSRVSGLGLTFAGVDWGSGSRSYTVLVILSVYNDRFVIHTAKRYTGDMADSDLQIKDIAYECKKHGVTVIGVDMGFGFHANSSLRLAFSRDRVLEYYSSHQMSKAIKWEKKANRYTLHRTTCMSRVINGIKRNQFRFPRWELWRPFAQDMLNVQVEYDDKKRVMKYTHREDAPDDAFHATMYAMLSAEIFTGTIVVET